MTTTKQCSKCNQVLSINDFSFRNNKPKGHCKSCQRSYVREHYKKNKSYYLKRNSSRKQDRREWLSAYLQDKKCLECGESRIECLDFHHIDAEQKKGNVTFMMLSQNLKLETIMEEIKKCVILCANCHRVKTAKEFGWYRSSE